MSTRSAAVGDQTQAVRQQLERVLASAAFRQADRLKRFLQFIVTESADGRADQIKEYVVGVHVFGKEDTFDPRTDPVVRVQARRLRARLVRYYETEGRTDDVVIDLPKGGYAPVTRRREAAAAAARRLSSVLVTQNTVAVVPFADLSTEGSLQVFCRGLRQEVIHALTALDGLRVLAPSDVLGRSTDPGEVARETGAAVAIGGSVRAAGGHVRVTAQLVDGVTGCYVWSESIDGCLEDAIDAQERAARAVAAKLEAEFTGSGRQRALAHRPENLAAHNLYLQGRYHLNQRTEEGLHKALEFFEKALAEDAEYALAHAGLADAYGLLGHYGVRGPAEVWTKAASSATQAVLLAPASVEARTSLAHVKATQDWDFVGAEEEYRRALAIDPRHATTHHWYAASCLAPLGRLDEALEHMRLAQTLDPVSPIIARDVAAVRYYRRELDAALEQCDDTVELNPYFSPAYWMLGLVQEQRHDIDESIAALQRAVQLSPRSPRMQGALARMLALAGRQAEAARIRAALEAMAAQRYVSPFEFASIDVALGDVDSGFRWLRKACDDRAFEMILVNVDPRFDAIRHDERFRAIVRQVGIG